MRVDDRGNPQMHVKLVDVGDGGREITTVGYLSPSEALAYMTMIKDRDALYMDMEGETYTYFGHLVEPYLGLTIQLMRKK